MKSDILTQLALSTLLPSDLATEIRKGIVPPLHELVEPLVNTLTDCYHLTNGDPKSTWNERRLSRQSLALGFLLLLVLYCGDGAGAPTEPAS
ncbi:MAG TPA: hypothetical protein VN736_15120 [Candidatus Limnocylindrales bacterium]|jgi:hypothetical protein|nr:hypothetical protein [Candidatus Limnocylindrales bacterium]